MKLIIDLLKGRLLKPEYYFDMESGGLVIVFWKKNRPSNSDDWLQISKKQFNKLYNYYSDIRRQNEVD